MKLSTALVAVKKITSNVDRANFSEDDLNRVARLILSVEGVINPPLLRQISLESYEVVDGDFEYYAAVRARELDPLTGEFLSAFILNSDNEATLKQQVEVLRQSRRETTPLPVQVTEPTLTPAASHPPQIDLTDYVNQVKGLIQQLENSLQIKLEHSLQSKFGGIADRIDRLDHQLQQLQESGGKGTSRSSTTAPIDIQPGDYRKLTVPQLRAIAKERGLTGYSKLTKSDLIEQLQTGT